MYSTYHISLRILLVALISFGSLLLGYLGGVWGGASEPLDIDDLSLNRPIIFEQGSDRTMWDETLSQGFGDIQKSAISIYRIPAKTLVLPDATLTKDRRVAQGVALTADGWVAVHGDLSSLGASDIAAIDSQSFGYEVTAIIRDPSLPITYLKTDAKGLKPVQFANRMIEHVEKGLLVGSTFFDELVITPLEYTQADNERQAIRSSHLLEKRYSADKKFESKGLPVFGTKNELIGITDADGIIPAYAISEALSDLLRNKKISRVIPHIRYYDRSEGFKPSETERTIQGAQVISAPGILLKPGDLIIRVNNEDVNGNLSFSELLHQYRPKDSVTLTILRGAQTRTVSLTLP